MLVLVEIRLINPYSCFELTIEASGKESQVIKNQALAGMALILSLLPL